MQIIFIYDSIELEEALNNSIILSGKQSILKIKTVDENKNLSLLFDIAGDISTKIKFNEETVIVIPQYLQCSDTGFNSLSDNAGIALIKFLRLANVKDHIVLISPFTALELVQQNPGNLITTSKGVSVEKYHFDFFSKTTNELNTLTQQKFGNKEQLRPYILTEFSLPESERHNWANWWGIDRLWNVQRVVEKEKYGLTEKWNLKEYPDNLKTKIKELNNYEALFLYGHKEETIFNRLRELNEETEKISKELHKYTNARDSFIKEINALESQINDKSSEIKKRELRISYINSHLPKLNGLSKYFEEKRAECFKSMAELSRQIKELESEFHGTGEVQGHKHRIRKINNDITERKRKLEESKNLLFEEEEKYLSLIKLEIEEIDKNAQKLKSQIRSLSIFALRKDLKEKSPKILYIDDQADEGWSNIFQHIIYNEEKGNLFKVIQPKETEKINAQYFSNVVHPVIISHNPELILLDLRLNKESGLKTKVEELSGAKLLREIRKQFSAIPILITTASNKSWSFEELQHMGCDAFWTKEGIDTGMAECDSVKNYIRFAELVNILTDGNYKFLSAFASGINVIQVNKKQWWWENSQYALDKKVSREEIITILNHTLFIIREFIKNEVINPNRNEQKTNWLLPSLIIHNLGKIPELIYNTWIVNYMFDKYAQQLYMLRNYASHIVQAQDKITAKNFSFSDVMEECKNLLVYLELDKKPDITEFISVSDEKLSISREQLMKNIEDTKRKK